MSALKLPLVPTSSGAVIAYGYHEGARKLAITFKGGKTYLYHNVPPAVFTELVASKSRGTFVSTNIVGKFDFTLQPPDNLNKSGTTLTLPEETET